MSCSESPGGIVRKERVLARRQMETDDEDDARDEQHRDPPIHTAAAGEDVPLSSWKDEEVDSNDEQLGPYTYLVRQQLEEEDGVRPQTLARIVAAVGNVAVLVANGPWWVGSKPRITHPLLSELMLMSQQERWVQT
jgi:hypothetical protein